MLWLLSLSALVVNLLCILGFNIDPLYKIKNCKHGTYLFHTLDTYVGTSLDEYGEWCEYELLTMLQVIRPGAIVVDVGANIGGFTIPLAKHVGFLGFVHAIEPQRAVNQILNTNIVLNGLHNVKTYQVGVGAESGYVDSGLLNYSLSFNHGAVALSGSSNSNCIERIPVTTLDSMDFTNPMTGADCPDFIKIDVELMEIDVILGGLNLLKRCQSIFYVENACANTSKTLIDLIYSLDYVPYWDVQFYFNPDNFNNNSKNKFGHTFAINVLAIPKWVERSIGLVVIEQDRPLLRSYYSANFLQAGNETSCAGAQFVRLMFESFLN